MARTTRLGLTRTQAHSTENRGYKHHALLPISQARPTLAGVDYIATPISEEGVMLYSFSNAENFLEFKSRFNAEDL